MTERYKAFHQQGRWQGLPLRVEDSDDRARFVPIQVPLAQHAGPCTQDFPDTESGFPQPDILILGVPNEGMMAGQPTNVFVMGYVADEHRSLTLIDTGSDGGYAVLEEALTAADIAMERIGQIVLTHCHPDHVGNAARIKAASNAQTMAHPLEQPQIERFGQDVTIDHWIEDDQRIECDGFVLETIFTPGHSPGHFCVVEPTSGVLIAGDMISGFGSVGIFPPNGNMDAYITSLRRLLAEHGANPFALVCPGHGPVVADAGAKIAEYIEHRLQREEEVVAAITSGADTVDAMLPIIYPDVQPHLAFAARSTLQAHLDKLESEHRVKKSAENTYAAVGE